MNKELKIAEMCQKKADNNNTIDLNAYAIGLSEMYDELANQLPVINKTISEPFEIKEGDYLEAIDECEMDNGMIAMIVGKEYKVVGVNADDIYVKTEFHREHSFSKDIFNHSYYGIFFRKITLTTPCKHQTIKP